MATQMKWRATRLMAGAAAATLVFASIQCGDVVRAAGEGRSAQGAATGRAPGMAGEFVQCSGRVAPRRQWRLQLRPGEAVAAILVEDNARVAQGTPLVQLANDALLERRLALSDRIRQLKKEEANLGLLEIEIKGQQELVQALDDRIAEEQGIAEKIADYPLKPRIERYVEDKRAREVSLRLLAAKQEAAQRSVASNRPLLELCEKQIAAVNGQIEALLMRAPFAGTVTHRNLNPTPERLGPGELVMELVDEDALIVRANVWQNQIMLVRKGAKAVILPDFQEGVSVSGVVTAIETPGETREGGQNMFPVVLELKSAGGLLRPGLLVTVQISTGATTDGERPQ